MIENIVIALVGLYMIYMIGNILLKIKMNMNIIDDELDIPVGRTSQYKGVYYDRTKQRWKSGITINKVRYNAGSFKTEEEAFYALEQLKAELNFERQ